MDLEYLVDKFYKLASRSEIMSAIYGTAYNMDPPMGYLPEFREVGKGRYELELEGIGMSLVENVDKPEDSSIIVLDGGKMYSFSGGDGTYRWVKEALVKFRELVSQKAKGGSGGGLGIDMRGYEIPKSKVTELRQELSLRPVLPYSKVLASKVVITVNGGGDSEMAIEMPDGSARSIEFNLVSGSGTIYEGIVFNLYFCMDLGMVGRCRMKVDEKMNYYTPEEMEVVLGRMVEGDVVGVVNVESTLLTVKLLNGRWICSTQGSFDSPEELVRKLERKGWFH